MLFFKAAPRHLAATIISAVGLALAALPVPVAAQGDLLVAPTRLILDGRQGGEVILSNIGNEESTYRITVELRRMTPDGQLEPVEESEANITEKAALEMIRYAPRRVTLPPGQPQAIRISARPGAELPDGEYRVHMFFAAVPKVQPIEETAETPTEGFVVKLTPIYGITMPIIVRKGALDVTAGLSNPRLEQLDGVPTFAVDITRSGQASIYGDILVYRQGSSEPAFVVRGIGVYPEISDRLAAFSLSPDQAAEMRGPVRVELREPLQTGAALIASLDAVLR